MSFQDNARAAFGRMVRLSAEDMDNEAFEGLQMDVTALLVRYKRESRARTQKLPLVAETTTRPVPTAEIPASSTGIHNNADSDLASGIARQQIRQCPTGYLPDWQHEYQQAAGMHQAKQQRSSSTSTDIFHC